MIVPKNVTFVLGAGVSHPYGFPLGSSLVEEIIRVPSVSFVKQTPTAWFSTDQVEAFQRNLQESGRVSIDRFLQHRPDDPDLGKTLIAYVLMDYENPDDIFVGNREKNGIYSYLYNSILNPQSPDKLNEKRIVIVTYNYDRSLEFFFLNALKAGFGISVEDAANCLKALPIYHIHGSLGEIVGPDSREYGRHFGGIESARNRLSIVSEDIEASGVLNECWSQIALSKAIVFLGFGFDPTNVRRLRIPEIMQERQDRQDGDPSTIYGTTHGLIEAEITHRVRPLFPQLPQNWSDSDCLSYLRNLVGLF